jgi:gamma-glutamylcyclotransferase (GGCT)/AIG2-like uncharacterized protein YtfP
MEKQQDHKYVCVYGTLRQGQRLNYAIRDGRLIEQVELSGFEMYTNSSYPWITHGEGKIVAEVWEVNEDQLGLCDQIELGAGYNKEEIEVDTEEGKIKCVIYVYEHRQHLVDNHPRIESGDFVKDHKETYERWACAIPSEEEEDEMEEEECAEY